LAEPGISVRHAEVIHGLILSLLHASRPNFIKNPKYIDPKALAGVSRPACGLRKKKWCSAISLALRLQLQKACGPFRQPGKQEHP
jgi:hypothetical protein